MTSVEATVRVGEDLDQRTARLSDSAVLSVTAEGKLLHRLHAVIDGKYQLLGALGQGGMGTVYLAHDLQLDRDVAIKVMLPELAPDPDTVERFRREARTVASLHHPNIVPVYGVHESDDLAYFVMRYVRGRTLDSVLRRHGPLPLEVARSVLRQVGTGLGYAHRHGVIHRDIKPANIMIDEDGWALIADFGIAKVQGRHDITRTGMTVGTPSYMSPEQCSDLGISSASDQYALGIVAYELLTGHPPFRGSTVAAVVTKHLFDTPPPLDELLPECPPESARAVSRMLAKSAGLRWPSIEEAVRNIGGRLDADSEVSRKQIASVAEHGEEVQVTWLDPVSLTPTAAPVVVTRRIDAPRRRPSRWLYRAGGGAVAMATVGVLTLALQGTPRAGVMTTPTDGAVVSQESEQPATGPEAALPEPEASITSPSARPSAGPARTTPADGTDSGARASAARPVEPQATPPPVAGQGPAPRAAVDEGGGTGESESGADASDGVTGPAVTGTGSVLLGTRGFPAVLYVNDAAQGAASRLTSWPIPAGDVRLSIRMDGCAPWDSLVSVQPDEQLRIGYRNPQCDG